MSEHQCSRCKANKPDAEFRADSRCINRGVRSWCKQCERDYATEVRRKRGAQIRITNVAKDGIKLCSMCKRELPVFYFYKKQSQSDGLFNWCKDCDAIKRGDVPRFRSEFPDGMRYCYRCKTVKSVNDFTGDRWCKACVSYYEANERPNKDLRRQYRLRYYAENKDNILRKGRIYRLANPGKMREQKRRYASNNKEVLYSNKMKRRSSANNLPFRYTVQDWERCIEYWNNCCCVCGRSADERYAIAREHWIPISDPRPDNPGTSPENIVPMCHGRKGGSNACNNSKYNLNPVEWLNRRYEPEQAAVILDRVAAYFAWVIGLNR